MAEAPATIDEGLENGVYKLIHHVGGQGEIAGGSDENGEFLNLTYQVPWEFKRNFLDSLLGPSKLEGSDENSLWTISLPHQCPIEGFGGLRAFTQQWRPWGTLEIPSGIEYTDFIVTVQYRTPFFNANLGFDINSITNDPAEQEKLLWATQNVDSHLETTTIGKGEWMVSEGPNTGEIVSNAPTTKTVVILDLILTFQRLPFFPRATMLLGADDAVNDKPFLGFPSETVRYVGMSTELKAWVGGFRTRALTLKFQVRPEAPWNYMFHKGIWSLVENTEANPGDLFKPKDFTPLLLPTRF